MQGYRPIIAINIVVLLILCVVVAYFAECHDGAGRGTAGNVAAEDAAAKDATGKATIGSAVAATSDDAVAGTAIAGLPDVTLNFGGETVTVTPFIPDFRPEDYARNLVEVQPGLDLDERELFDGTTGHLWAVSITTQAVYEVEEVYLDAQHRRLYLRAINKQGEPPSSGHFCLEDGFTREAGVREPWPESSAIR